MKPRKLGRWGQDGTIVVLLFLAIILCVGGVAGIFSLDNEYFPFASYSLFSIVPNIRTAYDIQIHEYHGRTIAPPVFLEEASELGIAPTSTLAFNAIQKFGDAYASGRTAERDYWRHLLEQDVLHPPGKYELVLVKYDPLERWNLGRIREIHDITSFAADS